MKKPLSVLAFVCLLFGTEAQAQDNFKPTLNPWTTSFYTIWMSQYYGSIVGGIFYNGPMSFTGITFVRKDSNGAWYVDGSAGQKLDDGSFDKDGGNEYDFKFGRSGMFGPGKFPVHYDASETYLFVHPLGQTRNDVLNTTLQLDLPKTPIVQPYVVVYRFDVVNGIGSGTFVASGIVRSQKTGLTFKGEPFKVNLEYRFGYCAQKGLFGMDEGATYHRFILSTTFKLSEKLSLTPMFIGQMPAGGQRSGQAFADRSRVFGQLNINYSFK